MDVCYVFVNQSLLTPEHQVLNSSQQQQHQQRKHVLQFREALLASEINVRRQSRSQEKIHKSPTKHNAAIRLELCACVCKVKQKRKKKMQKITHTCSTKNTTAKNHTSISKNQNFKPA